MNMKRFEEFLIGSTLLSFKRQIQHNVTFHRDGPDTEETTFFNVRIEGRLILADDAKELVELLTETFDL
jgi:hypothetical protein